MDNTSFSYQLKQGDGYWSLARYVRDHSQLSPEAKNDPGLIKQLAEAIQKDLQNNGVNSLQVGETVQLHSAEYYIPSLAQEKIITYEVQQGDGYWSLARKVCVEEGTADTTIVKQVAKAIEKDLQDKGITGLKPGQKIQLRSVDYYISKSPPPPKTKTETDGAVGTLAQITQAQQERLARREREKKAAELYEKMKTALTKEKEEDNKDDAKEDDTKEKKIIILDPGHGGVDPGATYPILSDDPNVVSEKEIVRKLAKSLKSKLSGYIVKSTRSLNKDEPVPDHNSDGNVGYDQTGENEQNQSIDDRVFFANNMDPKPDLFISLHVNSNESSAPRGMNGYTNNSSKGKKGHRFLEILKKQLKADGFLFHGEFIRFANHGVTRRTKGIPAVLLEIGFLSNEADRKNLQNDAYLTRMASSIKTAIDLFFDE